MIEHFRLAYVGDVTEGVEAERVGIKTHRVAHFVAQFFGVHTKYLRCIGGHRTIDIYGDMRQAPVVIQLVEDTDDRVLMERLLQII